MSPEETYKALVTTKTATEAQFNEVYDALGPVEPEFLIGQWKGEPINAAFHDDHPSQIALKELKWAGKDFLSVDDVKPIMVHAEDGSRVPAEKWGTARLRKVEFRGVVSTAMIYDSFPIIDSFRYVDDNFVAGLMDAKGSKPYHFFLERLSPKMKT